MLVCLIHCIITIPNLFDHSGFESQKAFQPKLLIVLFCVLFVCKCVLYYCHRVSTQLHLTHISYHIISYRITSLIIPKYSVAERAVRTTILICVKVAKAKLRQMKHIHCGKHRVAGLQRRKYQKRELNCSHHY